MKKRSCCALLSLLLLLPLAACGPAGDEAGGPLGASGTIAAREVHIAAEMGGQVVEIFVAEGDPVEAGTALFRLDDALLQAQRSQAAAAVEVARAAVEAAEAQLAAARLQHRLALEAARLQDQPSRLELWRSPAPEEFTLPAWYFEKSEEISAAAAEVATARDALDVELADLELVLRDASNADLRAAERRLAEAQAAFRVAQQTLAQATGVESLQQVAQDQFDAAKTALEAAWTAYNRLLSSAAAADVLEARSRVAVARARHDNAVDRLSQLLTGENARQVEVAQAAVRQAEAAVGQARAGLSQAEAALALLDVQLQKVTVYAPMDGVVLSSSLEVGEIASPGSTAMVLGQLREVRLTVYIGEAHYGRLQLGQPARITVDSFPGETFSGTVVRIADKAEFTPRNVQTTDGRQSTVYAVDVLVANAGLKLKPGMPADVRIGN